MFSLVVNCHSCHRIRRGFGRSVLDKHLQFSNKGSVFRDLPVVNEHLGVSAFLCCRARQVAMAAGEPQDPVVGESSESLVVDLLCLTE